MSNDINNLKTEVENSKKNLNSLIKNGNKQKSDTVDNEAYANLVEYYNDLFNTYSFDYVETDIKDVFGYFSETKGVNKGFLFYVKLVLKLIYFKLKFDSTIMDIGLQKQLIKICDLPLGKKWELKYRASKDGFKSTDFHTKCDGIGNTLTVIKAKSGNIFGGFTEQEWHSIGEFVTDPKAFIFSLVNKEEKPFKILCSNGGRDAIYCGLNRGPCFGGEGYCIKDICIDTDSNLNKTSDCDLGFSYRHPDYVQDTDKAQNILAGSQYFETLEIEVFAKQLDTLTV